MLKEGTGNNEREALLRLTCAHGIGPRAIALLLTAFGTAERSLAADPPSWSEALGCAPCRASRCLAAARGVDLGPLLQATEACGARLLARSDVEYPSLLRSIDDAPPILWMRGQLTELDDWAVAVVGSRRASAYGLDQASRFARGLVEHGHTIVSGGARGIDAEAHRAALRAGGRTIAVLGSGLACPYPPEHAALFDAIADGCGAVVSEHPPLTEPRSGFFPRRNRIIAGLALGVLLIEARARSGAGITARLAVEDYGREVMALPGRVDSPTSEGPHRAIREGWAALVAQPSDVIEHLRERGAPNQLVQGARGLPAAGPGPHEPNQALPGGMAASPTAGRPRDAAQSLAARRDSAPVLSAAGRAIAAALVRFERATFDQVLGDLEPSAVLAELTLLELSGHVRRTADGHWEARESLLAFHAQP